jgi:hypothetical protein
MKHGNTYPDGWSEINDEYVVDLQFIALSGVQKLQIAPAAKVIVLGRLR